MIPVGCCLTIPPNWDETVKLEHRYKTGIQKALWGKEKRAGYRSRYSLAELYQFFTVTVQEKQWLQRKLYKHQAEAWGIPVWPDGAQLTAQFGMSDTVITVNSTFYRHFAHCPYVILIQDYANYEYFPVTQVTETTITVTATTHLVWPIGSWVYPMFPALLNSKISVKNLTASLYDGKIEVEELIEHIPAEVGEEP